MLTGMKTAASTRTTLTFPDDIYGKIQDRAHSLHMSIAEYLVQLARKDIIQGKEFTIVCDDCTIMHAETKPGPSDSKRGHAGT